MSNCDCQKNIKKPIGDGLIVAATVVEKPIRDGLLITTVAATAAGIFYRSKVSRHKTTGRITYIYVVGILDALASMEKVIF